MDEIFWKFNVLTKIQITVINSFLSNKYAFFVSTVIVNLEIVFLKLICYYFKGKTTKQKKTYLSQ